MSSHPTSSTATLTIAASRYVSRLHLLASHTVHLSSLPPNLLPSSLHFMNSFLYPTYATYPPPSLSHLSPSSPLIPFTLPFHTFLRHQFNLSLTPPPLPSSSISPFLISLQHNTAGNPTSHDRHCCDSLHLMHVLRRSPAETDNSTQRVLPRQRGLALSSASIARDDLCYRKL